jgi:hypothetical protein
VTPLEVRHAPVPICPDPSRRAPERFATEPVAEFRSILSVLPRDGAGSRKRAAFATLAPSQNRRWPRYYCSLGNYSRPLTLRCFPSYEHPAHNVVPQPPAVHSCGHRSLPTQHSGWRVMAPKGINTCPGLSMAAK